MTMPPRVHPATTLPLGDDGRPALTVGVVDVLVLRRIGETWEVLTLRRSADTRCPGAWELVHGRIEPGERPHTAALREVTEETGLTATSLYSITSHPFFAPALGGVHVAIAFAAVIAAADVTPVLGAEHDAFAWRTPDDACTTLAWPREHELVRHAMWLLRSGDAGAVADVLQMPLD